MNNYLFLDLETTGLDITKAKICQIGIIFNDKKWNIIINPGISIPSEASFVHKITDDMVVDKPHFCEVAPKLNKMIESANCLVGYNIRKYDWPVLYIEMLRCGIELPHIPLIDVYEMIAELEKSKKLKDVVLRHLGVEFTDAHDALNDIEQTKEVYTHIMSHFYS
jgi:DNA polymerase-3 subunit epsilon